MSSFCRIYHMATFDSFLFWCCTCYSFISQETLTMLNFLLDCCFISRSLSMNSPMREISLKIVYFFLYVVKFLLQLYSAHFPNCAVGHGGYPKGWFLSFLCPSHVEVHQPQTCSYIALLAWDFSWCEYQVLSPHLMWVGLTIILTWVLFLPKAKARWLAGWPILVLSVADGTSPDPALSRKPAMPRAGSAGILPISLESWIPPQR